MIICPDVSKKESECKTSDYPKHSMYGLFTSIYLHLCILGGKCRNKHHTLSVWVWKLPTSSRFLAHAASVGRFDWPELGKLFSPWRKFSFTLTNNMWQKMGKASIAHSRKCWCNGHSYCSNSSRHACFYSTTSVTMVIGENLSASLFPPSNALPSL